MQSMFWMLFSWTNTSSRHMFKIKLCPSDFNFNFICDFRFHSIAYLRQIWWFEVNGEVEFPFPVGTYSVFFRLQLGRAWGFGRGICDPEQVHGWDIKPVRFQLWTSGDKHSTWECSLSEAGKWFHYHVGDFNVENPSSSTKIKLSMSQIDCTHTKGGLCLDSVVICPSAFRERLEHKGFLKCTKPCCRMLHSI